jgi:hypothetical protein
MKSRGAFLAMALFWIATMLVSCSAAPETPPEMYQGTMASGCAPHDAPSTVIQLEATVGESLVSFNLWPSPGLVPPTTVQFDASHTVGQAAYCTEPGACEAAEWAEVTLYNPGPSGSVEGEWSLGLEDGRVHRGRFAADWLAIQALCG